MEWAGLPEDEKSWEDVETIKRLTADPNLEDKIKSNGRGDVTMNLDLQAVVAKLRQELELTETDPGEEEATEAGSDISSETTQPRPKRMKQGTKNSDCVYF